MTKACDIAVWLDWPATIQVFDSDTGEERDYTPERTTTLEKSFIKPGALDNIQEYLCRACGEYMYHQVLDDGDTPKHCSNCGARVEKRR